MKKITIVGQYDPYDINVGGIEIYTQNLINQLEKQNYKFNIFGWSSIKKESRNFKPIIISKKLLGRKFTFNLFIKAPFMTILKGTSILVDRPDRIIPFLFRKNKLICMLHGSHSKNVYQKKGKILGIFYSIIEYIALKRADIIISVSEENKRYYLKRFPSIKNKISVIPIGVNKVFKPMDKKKLRKKYGLNEKNKIAVYIGRLEKEKQVEKIIKVFSKIDTELVIVGDGREEEKLIRLSANQKNIRFLGSLEYKKIPEIMNCADFLILFSTHEGLPTVILEALSCGIPVISSKVGDVPLVIKEGKNGYIANQDNLSKKIKLLIKNSKNMKSECLKTGKKYSWDIIAKKILKLI